MKYNVENLFYSEFYGAKWTWDVPVTVSWSVPTGTIKNLNTNKNIPITQSSAPYIEIYQRAFDLWDDALDSVDFVKTNEGNNADIAIAIVNIDGRYNTQAQFTYTGLENSGERITTKASIMVDQADIGYVDFLGLAMHEIGNVLGLGDLRTNDPRQSVQRDGIPEAFTGQQLWDFDYYAIRSWYEESTGPRATPSQPANQAAEVSLANRIHAIDEDVITTSRIKIADIVITDDGRGSNTLSLTGADASMFQIANGDLFLRAGAKLDHDANPRLDVTVRVDDSTIPGFPEDSTSLIINVREVASEPVKPAVTSGNDNIRLQDGNETINTSGGFDTVIAGMHSSDATLKVISGNTVILEDRAGDGGFDRISNAERLVFEDRTIDLTDFRSVMTLPEDDFRDLAEMYVAYFNRAPDAEGLNYWAEQMSNGMSLGRIAEFFFDQNETRALYGSSSSTKAFVEAVYDNVLGRTPDGSGFTFWQNAINSGEVTRGKFVLEIIQGAKSPGGGNGDAEYLAMKADLGLYYSTILGMSNVSDARDVMEEFGSQAQSDLMAGIQEVEQHYAQASRETNGDFLVPLVGVADVTLQTSQSSNANPEQGGTQTMSGGLLNGLLDFL